MAYYFNRKPKDNYITNNSRKLLVVEYLFTTMGYAFDEIVIVTKID